MHLKWQGLVGGVCDEVCHSFLEGMLIHGNLATVISHIKTKIKAYADAYSYPFKVHSYLTQYLFKKKVYRLKFNLLPVKCEIIEDLN